MLHCSCFVGNITVSSCSEAAFTVPIRAPRLSLSRLNVSSSFSCSAKCQRDIYADATLESKRRVNLRLITERTWMAFARGSNPVCQSQNYPYLPRAWIVEYVASAAIPGRQNQSRKPNRIPSLFTALCITRTSCSIARCLFVCQSLRSSVCLSHAGILPKWLDNIGLSSNVFQHRLATPP